MVVSRTRFRQVGLGLLEMTIAVAISAMVMLALRDMVRLGLTSAKAVHATNELRYHASFALDRIAEQARTVPQRPLSTPAANTTGDVLDDAQQSAMQDFVRAGGGFMGIHSAADTEYDWPWYGELVGAWFLGHPPGLQTARVRTETGGVLTTPVWRVTDELYNFRSNPRERVQVLATVDEREYAGGTMGADHPIAWCHAFDGGRAWYTGLGHDITLYADANFLDQLRGGLRYVTGLSMECRLQ